MSRYKMQWDRQEGEPEDAWTAFWRWRDAGAPQLVAFAATTGYGAGALRRWFTQWSWDARYLAWSQNVDGRRQEATLSATEEMARAHIELAQQGLGVVRVALGKMAADLATDYGRLKAQEIARLLDVCAKLERLSRGEATERVEGQDYSRLTDADLQALAEIAKKCGT